MISSCDELHTALEYIKKLEAEVARLRSVSEHDVLIPSILNRRGMENRFLPLMEEAFLSSEKRYASTQTRRICIAYFDIDNFKNINDFYGHDNGDEVLLVFGGILRSNARKTDIICRLGGDEFVAVYLNSSFLEAEKKTKKIANIIKECQFSFNKEARVTTSFGIACAEEFNEATTLIAAAEQRMRVAKGSRAR